MGCAPRPAIPGQPSTPAPSVDPARATAARTEWALGGLALDVASVASTWNASPALVDWCGMVSRMHIAHAQVLVAIDPFQPDSSAPSPSNLSPTPRPDFVDLRSALAALADAEMTAADAAEVSGAPVTDASLALLWGALAITARSAQGALKASPDGSVPGPPPVAGTGVPTRVAVGTRQAALSVLLSHLNPLIYALEVVVARAPDDRTSSERLLTLQLDREAASAAMRAEGLMPSAPAADYQLPGDLHDPSQVPGTLGRLELNLQAAWARVAAASSGADRVSGWQAMAACAAGMRTGGVPQLYWPGWV